MKLKSATCSTGHGTGVIMPVPLAQRLWNGGRHGGEFGTHRARPRRLGVTVTPTMRHERAERKLRRAAVPPTADIPREDVTKPKPKPKPGFFANLTGKLRKLIG